MVAVPAAIPLTWPELLTVAMAPLLLAHGPVPLDVRVVVPPTHADNVPVTSPAVLSTVTTIPTAQEVESV